MHIIFLPLILRHHVFNKEPVSLLRIIYEDMRDRADELSILKEWTSAHE